MDVVSLSISAACIGGSYLCLNIDPKRWKPCSFYPASHRTEKRPGHETRTLGTCPSSDIPGRIYWLHSPAAFRFRSAIMRELRPLEAFSSCTCSFTSDANLPLSTTREKIILCPRTTKFNCPINCELLSTDCYQDGNIFKIPHCKATKVNQIFSILSPTSS